MKSETRGRILLITTAVLWGLAGVCVKSITWGTMSISAARSLVSLLMILSAKRELRIHFTKINFLGGLMLSLTGILYVEAIKLTTAGTAIVLQYIAPILVFLYEVIFRKKKPAVWEVVLTGCVFLGVIVTFADSIDMTQILGNILALASGFTFAAHILAMNQQDSDSSDCTAIGNAITVLICLPFMLKDPALSFDRTNLIWILILSVFQYGLANVLFAKGCKLINDIEGSLILTIEPIFTPIPVAIICGEKMGVLAIIGAIIVIISVTLYGIIPKLTEKKKHPKA